MSSDQQSGGEMTDTLTAGAPRSDNMSVWGFLVTYHTDPRSSSDHTATRSSPSCLT